MPSPFPGMNPYLEQQAIWPSFHNHFNAVCLEHLTSQLSNTHYIQIEHRLYIHEYSAQDRYYGYDNSGATRPYLVSTAPAEPAFSPPMTVTLPETTSVERYSYLTIRTRKSREVATVIELLTPTNKRIGPDREQYAACRREILRSNAHFVELDLLRGDCRMPPEDRLPAGGYCVLVSRVQDRPQAGVWSWSLRQPMPTIPIPIDREGSDIVLDMKLVLDLVYDRGCYRNYLYEQPSKLLLLPDDAAWAVQFVPSTI